jgi:MFS family permease
MAYFRFFLTHPRVLSFGVLLTLFSSFGQTFLISIFVPRLLDEFALNTAQFGGLYAVATLTSAASLPFFGRLIDRVTLRSFSLAVGWGLVAACFLMATAPGVPVLFLAILGLRLTGQGLLSLTASTTMARVFTEGRGKALSVSGLGYPLGEGLLPMAIVLLVHAAGWRLSWGMASSLSAPSKGPWPPSAFSPPRWVRYYSAGCSRPGYHSMPSFPDAPRSACSHSCSASWRADSCKQNRESTLIGQRPTDP